MDWSTIGGIVGPAAPTLGKVLGGLLPIPGGSLIGEAAGKIVAEVLGVPPTPEAVGNAIQNGDPAVVSAALSEAEARINAEVRKFELALQDMQDARETNLKLVQERSPLQWGAPIVSVLITLGFLGSLAALMFFKMNFTETSGQALLLLVGSLATMQTQVVNYWLGSSSGSADKASQLAAIAAAAPKPTPPKTVLPTKGR